MFIVVTWVQEAIPGNIRNAELFIRFMQHVVRQLKRSIQTETVTTLTPTAFLYELEKQLHIDSKPLKFAYSRLNSLMRTLQVR